MMNVLIRVAAQAMHPFEVAFFRCLFGLLLMTPWIITSGPMLWRSRNKGFYLWTQLHLSSRAVTKMA